MTTEDKNKKNTTPAGPEKKWTPPSEAVEIDDQAGRGPLPEGALGSGIGYPGGGPGQDAAAEKKKPGFMIRLLELAIVAVLAVVLAAVTHAAVSPDHFPKGSTINGVNVAGMTAKQAEAKLADSQKGKTLKLTVDGKTVDTIKIGNLDYDISDSVEKVLRPGFTAGLSRFFHSNRRAASIPMTPAKTNPALTAQVKRLSVVKNAVSTKESKNAYVSLKSNEFEVVDEVYGDDLDPALLEEGIKKAIGSGKTELEYKQSDYVKQPKITADSKEIQKRLDFCKKYLSQEITYKTPLGDYTIKPVHLNKMIRVDSDGKVTVSEKAVKDFVANKLYFQVSTVGKTRTLKSAGGGTYTIAGGNYGYALSTEKETKALTEDLESGENVTREPKWDRKGSDTVKGNDIGNTFVEVSIPKQHVWCVIDGKTVLSTPVVTGKTSDGHATPYGICYLGYKQSPATLTGRNADGSDYESKVKYWMQFNGGVGLHDAPWRASFGGNIYQNNGSHGCVNMPPAAAAKLYSLVKAGMPVIVHA